jgi:2-oxo-4-hydroxy-4-carboxy-5-ureidoimidazoline decarboxylase
MSGLSQLNRASWQEAGNLLRACCAAPNWVVSMVAARPYAESEALRQRGAAELAELDWSQIRLALDAHPRIGERVSGTGAEADWSRREQAGMRTATDEVRTALVQANRDYEQRFGYVFLIFATGRTDTEMLAAARARLSHSDEQEQAVVRIELGRIVDLRLERLAHP